MLSNKTNQTNVSKEFARSPSDRIRGKMSIPSDVKKLKTGYMPRKIQLLIHESLRRFNVLVCHRRFGKTVLAVNQLIHRALCNPLRNPQYAYIAPTYKQAKMIAWQYFVDYTRHLPNVKCNRSELTVYIERPHNIDPGTGEKDPDVIKIMLIGADDPDALRGLYLDGCIPDEYAQCDPIIWGQILRPALADRKKYARDLGIKYDRGGNLLEPWAIFIGTPKGQNHFYRRYKKAKASEKFRSDFERENDIAQLRYEWEDFEQTHGIDEDISQVDLKIILDSCSSLVVKEYAQWRKYKSSCNWFTAIYKASETGILSIEEMDEMTEDLDDNEIQQELECDFTAAILGSYYGHLVVKAQKAGRITSVPYDPRFPVETFWDIGRGDKTAIWFRQKINGKYHYIDYYEKNGKNLDHYVALLNAKEKYDGGSTEIDEGEMIKGEGYRYGRHIWPHDGAVMEWGGGQTRQETARTKGLRVFIQPKQRVEDRIEASRNRFKISYFDEHKCARGIECLYNYQKEYDSKLMVFKNTPKHDWSSDGADSFGYSALDDRDGYFPDDRVNYGQTKADSDYDELAA